MPAGSTPIQPDGGVKAGTGGSAGDAGGGIGGIGGTLQAGTGGFSDIAGIGGGFSDGPSGMCFDCGNGCFDCGMGAGCMCSSPGMFTPTPWQPPFTAIGAAGWKDSTVPLCGGIQQINGFDVWADATGVYALVVGMGPNLNEQVVDDDAGVASTTVNGTISTSFGPVGGFQGGPGFEGMFPTDQAPRTRIWHNDGKGWALRAEGLGGSTLAGLTGVNRGPLILYSNSFPEEFACRLGMTTRGGFNCFDVDPIQDVVVVNGSLAYALMGTPFTGGTRLLAYDGTTWRSHGPVLPYPALRLWADATDVIAIGNAGTLMRMQQGAWVLEDIGALEGLTAIWGTSIHDLWIGTSTGKVFHQDGNGWKEAFRLAGKTCDSRQPVLGIWGAGSTLYAHTPSALVRWKNGELSTLGNWTCGLGSSQHVRAIWGRSENDLFVGLVDESLGSECGASYVAHFDGVEFHRM